MKVFSVFASVVLIALSVSTTLVRADDDDECVCSVCTGLTAKNCNSFLTNVLQSYKSYSELHDIYEDMLGTDLCSDSMTDLQCTFTMADAFDDYSMARQTKYLEQACCDGMFDSALSLIQAETESKSLDTEDEVCLNCVGLSKDRCAGLLKNAFLLLSSSHQEAIVSAFSPTNACGFEVGTECTSNQLAQFLASDVSDQVRHTVLLRACSQNMLITAPPVQSLADGADSATCEACESLTDKACLAALDDAVDSMTDKARLALEEELFDDYSTTCDGLADKVCLSALDAEMDELTDKERLALLTTACAESSLELDAVTESDCALCASSGLNRAQCGTELDKAMRFLNTASQVSAMKTMFSLVDAARTSSTECPSSMDTDACATMLSALMDKTSRETQVSMLIQGCAAGAFDSVSSSSSSKSGSSGTNFMSSTPAAAASISFLIGVALVVGSVMLVGILARRRRGYLQVPTTEMESTHH